MEPTLNYIIKENHLVSICCITYNHSNFIASTLNGFAIQQTNFPFICVVVDDCSPDGEQEVIKEWMRNECDPKTIQYFELKLSHLYVATHKNNNNCKYAFYLLKQNLRGDVRKDLMIEPWFNNSKYEALCEGDDYWIDPNKLQRQVDFLEQYSNYSATTSNASVLRSDSSKLNLFGSTTTKDFNNLKDVVVQRQFHTASVVFRISAMSNCPFHNKGDWDTFMWCCLLTQGPIHYDAKVTCVYRKQNQGVTESTPTMKWLMTMSNWNDIVTDCFVPKYVSRKYVVRSVTKRIIRAYFQKNKQLSSEDKKTLKSLYRHNFVFGNIIFDLKEVLRSCVEKVRKGK